MAFQLYLAVAVIAFVVLTVLAKSTAFFPFDLTISLAVQSYHRLGSPR